jgi:hypothetical protein
MNPLIGPTALCSSVTANYSASATNSPAYFVWSVTPSAGVVFNSQFAQNPTISFPASAGSYTLSCYATGNGGTSTPVTMVVTVFETPVVTFSGVKTFCQGSSTQLSASPTIFTPGSPTISYSWTPSSGITPPNSGTVFANPSVSTTYTVIYSMNSCTNSLQVAITILPLPAVSVTASPNPVCPGISSTISPAGNAASYYLTPPAPNFIVSPQFNTSYLVTGVGTNGCQNSAAVTVSVQQAPFVMLTANPAAICPGETATLTPGGNAMSYSLSSNSNTVSPVVNTVYFAFGQGLDGCVGTGSTQVIVKDLPFVSAMANPSTLCSGHITNINLFGTAFVYSITPSIQNNTFSPVSNTTFSVTGLGLNGCMNSSTLQVNVLPLPTIVASVNPVTICKGEKATLSATGSFSSFGFTNILPPYQVSPATSATYVATGTGANGCKNQASVALKVDPCSVVTDLQNTNWLSVYPNPSNVGFFVRSDVETEARIFSETGCEVRLLQIQAGTPVSITDLPPGIYFLVTSKSSKKIVVN